MDAEGSHLVMTDVQTERHKIRWNTVIGNRYLKKISPLMLYTEVAEPQKISIEGEVHLGKQWVEVIYDREYVETKIKKEFIEPLYSLGLKEIIKLITRVFKEVNKTHDKK